LPTNRKQSGALTRRGRCPVILSCVSVAVDVTGDEEYEVRLGGRAPALVGERFPRLRRDVDAGGETVLRGPLRDQAELFALLRLLLTSGADVLEVRRPLRA
jgi:hypothetical protein